MITSEADWSRLRGDLVTELQPPPVDQLIGRALRRRADRRRRAVGMAVTALVIAAIPIGAAVSGQRGATSAPAIVSVPTSSEPTFSVPAAGPATSSVSFSPSTPGVAGPVTTTPGDDSVVLDAGFATAGGLRTPVGFALVQRCRHDGACSLTLATTFDGVRWRERATPLGVPGITGAYPDYPALVVLTPTSVVVRQTTAGGQPVAWLTTDSGVTWRAAATQWLPADRLADGSVYVDTCGATYGACAGAFTVLTPTGVLQMLRTVPRINPKVMRQLGDRWAVWGTVPSDSRTVVWSTSDDQGRTWTAPKVLLKTSSSVFRLGLTITGTTAYLTVTGELPDVKNGLLALLVSRDSGMTWATAWQAHGTAQPRSTQGLVLLDRQNGPGRTVAVLTELGTCWTSNSSGSSFARDTSCDTADWVRDSGSWYVRTDSSGGLAISTNGRTWTQSKP